MKSVVTLLAGAIEQRKFLRLDTSEEQDRLALPRVLGSRGTQLVLVAKLGVDQGNYVVMSEWIVIEAPTTAVVRLGAEDPWNLPLDQVPERYLADLDTIIAQS